MGWFCFLTRLAPSLRFCYTLHIWIARRSLRLAWNLGPKDCFDQTKEKGTNMRFLMRFGAVLLPLFLFGCATDPREGLISSAIGQLNEAANKIASIKDDVDKSIAKGENNKLSAKELKDSYTSIEDLKNLSKEMQKIKQRADAVGGTLTADERTNLREQFQKRLNDAMANIERERSELEKKLVEAEAKDPDAVKELRSKLTEVEGNFVMLARQR
jgi:F0F1-type ATP synthase membrane subunit b/b'